MSGRRNRDNDNGDKLSAVASINLLNTRTHTLDAKGFIEKEYPKNSEPCTVYGTSLNYSNSNDHTAVLAIQHDANRGVQVSSKVNITVFRDTKHDVNIRSSWIRNVSMNDTLGGSLNYDRGNGLSVSIDIQRINDICNIDDINISILGKTKLYSNKIHSLRTSGKFTRTFRRDPDFSNYNTYSANLEYLYLDNIGASVGMTHAGLLNKTFFNSTGKFRFYKDSNTFIDFTFGFNKPLSFGGGQFEPNIGISFRKDF